ncbi:FxsA family protein [Mycolicibacter hiberniae]|uniref:FxsA family protein n=2 Tax=Mycolicibacter hiberniae TaxID=29314 RepID=UPI001F36480E|nr:FxsA family protein [Mycolicibacter hiberniae]
MMSAVLRICGLYVLVEVAVIAAMIWALGFGWTALLLAATGLAGLVLATAQVKRQLRRLRRPAVPGVLADSGLVTAGTMLVLVPGPVTTLAGMLLLAPPTRAAARPLLGTVAATALGRHAPLVAAATVGRQWYRSRRTGDYIDGEYIDAQFVDVTDTGGRALPVA